MKKTFQLAIVIYLAFSSVYYPRAIAQSIPQTVQIPEQGITVPQLPAAETISIAPLPQPELAPVTSIEPLPEPQDTKIATSTVPTANTAPGTSIAGCGDNTYANYIYTHESSCSLYNPNSSTGACGLGQAYPCSGLWSACPGLDYSCENNFFTRYAISRYGSWAGAYNFWIANRYW